MIKRHGKTIRTYFENNEIILFTKRGWRTGTIDFIDDGSITINNEKIPLNEIQIIKINRKAIHYKNDGKWLIIGGAGFLAIDVFNRLTHHRPPGIAESTAILSASFIISGIILKLLSKKEYKIGHRFGLKTMCF
ncbi:MAG: hypothetical protein NTX61_12895 [Bacteroidetes bacterium]|nr:hypothetical protein [Bacteroidota bacterium]